MPDEITEVASLLPDVVAWPDNVFSGEPMVDTRSRQFDKATSPGNVFYNKIYREEQIVMWELHAFGEQDVIHVYTAIESARLEKQRDR
jgi:hypothetical protein